MNNYHIYESIGKGVHSVVYKGRKKKHIEYYAIKSIQKTQKIEVHQEVKIIHDLKHPNILRFYNWYETGNHLWLILEYCVGGDLNSLIKQDMKLPEASVHDFGRDLLSALQHLHSNSIIHCDLKPSNVLLDENGTIKLGGFGLARKLADINLTPLHDLPPTSRGTPCYMAPELFQDGSTHSTASDLWALGCVLYECFVGRPPFMNPSFNELVRSILTSDYSAMHGASPEFADLIKRLLDKNPATRMTWHEMRAHPFWQFTMSPVTMPAEPALQNFIQRYNLAPSEDQENKSSQQATANASMRAQLVRESVDITRLSQIVRGNLEVDSEDHTSYNLGATAEAGDINLASADAELDFQVHQDKGQHLPANSQQATSIGSELPVTPLNVVGQRAVNAPKARPVTASEAASQALLGVNASQSKSGPIPSARPATVPSTGNSTAADAQVAAVDKLVFCEADMIVRPLVGNRKIERVPETRWEASMLPAGFVPWDVAMLHAKLQGSGTTANSAFSNFINHINGTMLGPSSTQVKVNLLAYVESLCTDAAAANALINTVLTTTLVRIFGATKNSALRVRIASVLGLLIRHASFINGDLISSGVVDTLREGLKDSSDKVRRRVMATLGEFLFYLSTIHGTQEQHQIADSQHAQMAASTWSAVVRLLHPGEDEFAQHYATKAIDNIATQLGVWPTHFASEDTAGALLQLLKTARNDGLRSTAGSALGRLLKFNPSLLPAVIKHGGLQVAREGLSHASVRIQIVCVNLFNWILAQSTGNPATQILLSDRQLLPDVMALLELEYAPIRGKGLVTLVLLIKLNGWWLLEACKLNLTTRAARMQSEQDDNYIKGCLSLLRSTVVNAVPDLLLQVEEGLSEAAASEPNSQQSTTQLFDVVLHLITSPIFRAKVVTAALIASVSRFLVLSWASQATMSAAQQEFSDSLMHALEAMCQPPDLLVVHCDAVVEHLMPALCQVTAVLLDPSEDAEEMKDLRVNAARMLADVLMFFVNHPDLYQGCSAPAAGTCGVVGKDMTKKLDAMLTGKIMPLLPSLMAERDPMPLYAQKVLAALLPRNPKYVEDVERANLVTRFFHFLSIESPSNNIHNIRVCRMIVTGRSISTQQLINMRVAEKVSHVLEYAHAHSVEPFLEPTVELCTALLQREVQDKPSTGTADGLAMLLVRNVSSFITFAGMGDSTLASTSSEAALLLGQIYPHECANSVLTDSGIDAMLETLGGHDGSVHPPAPITSNLLIFLKHCGEHGRASASAESVASLHQLVMTLRDHGDVAVSKAARDLAQLFG